MTELERARELLPTGPATKLDWFQVKALYVSMVEMYSIAERQAKRLDAATRVIAPLADAQKDWFNDVDYRHYPEEDEQSKDWHVDVSKAELEAAAAWLEAKQDG